MKTKLKNTLKAIARILLAIIGIKYPKLKDVGNEIINDLKAIDPDDPGEPLTALREEEYLKKNGMNRGSMEENDLAEKRENTLLERKGIENSPFMCVRFDTGWILVCGQYRLVDAVFNTFEEITEYIELHKWELVLVLASIAVQASLIMEKSTAKTD